MVTKSGLWVAISLTIALKPPVIIVPSCQTLNCITLKVKLVSEVAVSSGWWHEEIPAMQRRLIIRLLINRVEAIFFLIISVIGNKYCDQDKYKYHALMSTMLKFFKQRSIYVNM
ncbi:hypothetical protein [Chryseobacterium jejuense]|uniref:hypothetical protein n=1 Tax=Chryseobacterium jejuense TaxID=445960 RepID=UPI001AE100C6|nr:hypothetical protein [Chryseobacterium jejuense]MBP2618837.1 hypothetical protein [Chryseobacterium jejuense]